MNIADEVASVAIVKVTIKINGREIEMTSDEARRVNEELTRLFSRECPAIVPVPYPVYPTPVWIREYGSGLPHPWEITCGGSSRQIAPDSYSALTINC